MSHQDRAKPPGRDARLFFIAQTARFIASPGRACAAEDKSPHKRKQGKYGFTGLKITPGGKLLRDIFSACAESSGISAGDEEICRLAAPSRPLPRRAHRSPTPLLKLSQSARLTSPNPTMLRPSLSLSSF
ncbi:hypothetical protein RRG08_002344 [Elysia crispata]|uniref:Uncharacterized protein n=1 Tax=Elysia crispata TaxID=231223 RepID=A0AAE1DD63_9GAST|nr:hypothetical protein RRG08_002344 [Elysia crispata]